MYRRLSTIISQVMFKVIWLAECVLTIVELNHYERFGDQGAVSRKSRELFGPEKPFVKLRPAYSAKLIFSYVVKGIKIKITAKFHASRRLRFEDTKIIMSPEMRPKRSGIFEKRAPEEKNKIVVKC